MSDLGYQCEAFVRFEIDVPRNLLSAFEMWSSNTASDIDNESHDQGDIEDADESRRFAEYMSGKYALYERTKRSMYGTLAVAISSTAEKLFESACRWSPLNVTDSNGRIMSRPDYGAKTEPWNGILVSTCGDLRDLLVVVG